MITILHGDALGNLLGLSDQSVQCCITSPPYWGLRDYGTASWQGGDPECQHEASDRCYTKKTAAVSSAGAFSEAGEDNATRLKKGRWRLRGHCVKCGAVKIDNQIGLEETPDAYVAKIVEVFREVRRVLKDDGTLWLNLGDSYASDTKGTGGASDKQLSNAGSRYEMSQRLNHGLKPKDLCGIPWRVAFALQADGWYLRSDIIWHKPNPMPESVTDRPTKSHEYLFLLSKRERYFYESDAIKERSIDPESLNGRNARNQDAFTQSDTDGKARTRGGFSQIEAGRCYETRNKRSVWTVPTAPYSEAHFATFPPDLIKPCILAGTKSGDTVLDPFGGSGTTGAVAIELGRKALLIELNPAYISLIEQRCAITLGMPL